VLREDTESQSASLDSGAQTTGRSDQPVRRPNPAKVACTNSALKVFWSTPRSRKIACSANAAGRTFSAMGNCRARLALVFVVVGCGHRTADEVPPSASPQVEPPVDQPPHAPEDGGSEPVDPNQQASLPGLPALPTAEECATPDPKDTLLTLLCAARERLEATAAGDGGLAGALEGLRRPSPLECLTTRDPLTQLLCTFDLAARVNGAPGQP